MVWFFQEFFCACLFRFCRLFHDIILLGLNYQLVIRIGRAEYCLLGAMVASSVIHRNIFIAFPTLALQGNMYLVNDKELK